jgi:glycosyltransferase involved in cell wall biosynthesis
MKAGGMEINVRDLAYCLTKKGHEVTIIASHHPGDIIKEQKDKVTIFYTATTITPNPLSRIKSFKESAELFKNINKQVKFDIIHGHSDMVYGYINYCKKNVPVVVTTHGTTLSDFKSSLKTKFWLFPIWAVLLPLYYIIEKKVFDNSQKIICVSNELQKDVIRQYNVPIKKVITIFNGVDTNRFKPITRKEIQINKPKFLKCNDKIILSVGVITKQKGFHLLIKSFGEIAEKFPKIKLIIIGDGPYLKRLKSLTEKLALTKRVLFLGKIDNKEIHKFYNLADICVFPTLCFEGLPYVVLEAMACEKPVITSRIGGIPSIIKDRENGLLIEAGNSNQLEHGIIELLKNKVLAKNLGENARLCIIKEFSLHNMVQKTIRIYQEVV